jgi:hypothetical protein
MALSGHAIVRGGRRKFRSLHFLFAIRPMKAASTFALAATCVLLAACASTSSSNQAPSQGSAAAPAPAPAATPTSANTPFGPARLVKSRDGKFDGEIVGTPSRNSKFARLQIGMQMDEVTSLIGGPDNMIRHETGKRWIPFYFGNDARRMQVLYKGEGCLIFTGGGAFSSGGDLIQIHVDPSGACYVP